MTQQPYELLARFNQNGQVAGVSIRYLFAVGGKVVEGDPEPLAGTNNAAFTAFAEQFSAAAVSERDELKTQLDAANARITELLEQVQFNPRIIEANAFLSRIASTELAQLFASTDQNVQSISQMLLAYKANDWRIELDSTEMQQAVGYLQQIGMLTPERAAALLRDGTRAEAYIDDGSV